jgi:tail tube protein
MAYISSQASAGRGVLLQYQNGSASPAVYVTISEMRKMSITGAKYDLADVTNVQSGAFREWLPTLADSGELNFEGNYIPGDATQDVLNTAFVNAILTGFRILFNGATGNIAFNAYVVGIDRTIEVDKAITISGKLKITGPITLSN